MNKKPFSHSNNYKKFTEFWVAFFLVGCLLIVGSLLAILPTIPKVVAAQEEVIWHCSAFGQGHHYIVDQLVKKGGASFDLAIYQVDKSRPLNKDYLGPAPIDYLETVTLVASLDNNTALVATGQNSKGVVQVEAFGRTPAFRVKNSTTEAPAIGRCDRFWEMASSQTRKKIRECLVAVAREQEGNIAEAQRSKCLFIDQ
ncbi:hypothetical protein [Microcoleus sp. FACHB-672]|uniref:hypothetical protein n=1 Tax=Microcoleus sp. FACHB-672 TaxID=2692825 RepID=UPI0016872EE5|nr:hypothetical protein [Microcoleus sp. FACHB-672]MBD2041704.1 hypothetical protein [Microcoleus sp. FACHB-672]